MSSLTELEDMIKFRKLLKVVDYYRELENVITRDGAALNYDKIVFLIYGPSRSGKSALVARLFSSISIKEFLNYLNSSKIVKVPETDIEIGPDPKGVTTLANFRTLTRETGGELVIDLAGYGDCLQDRRPLVSILNKAVLSRIRSCRILFTINVYAFSVAGRPKFEDDYVNELVNLFTPEHYELALDSVSFVLTNVDKSGEILKKETRATTLEAAIQQSITSMFTAFASKPNVCILLAKILGNFVAMNYDLDDSTAAYKKIKTLIDHQKEPLKANQLTFSIANAGNEFNQVFTRVLTRHLATFDRIEKELDQVYNGTKQLLTSELVSIKKLLYELRTRKEERDRMQKESIDNLTTLANLNGQIEVQTKAIEDNERKVKELKLKEKEFEEQLQKEHSISVNPYRSRPYSTRIGSTNLINCDFVKPLGSLSKMPNMIALTEDAFGSGEIVELLTDCQSLETATNLLNSGIYAMNNAKTQAAAVDDFHWESKVSDTGISIKAKCKRPFVLILIYEINVKQGAPVKAVYGFFTKQNDAIKQAMVLAKSKLKHDQDMMATLNSTNETNKTAISKADTDIKELSSKITLSRNKCSQANSETPSVMTQKAVEVTNKLVEPDIQESSKVVEILSTNNIKATFGDIFRAIQTKGNLSKLALSHIKELSDMYADYSALNDWTSPPNTPAQAKPKLPAKLKDIQPGHPSALA